ncbi:MAG: hypothetical protein ABEJ65_07365, partial [bacterium]
YSEENRNVRLFEIGHVFPGNETEEYNHLGVVMTGNTYRENWDDNARELDFYDTSGLVSALFDRLDITPPEINPLEEQPGFDKQRVGHLVTDGEPIGVIGEVLSENLPDKIETPVWAIEFSLSDCPKPATPDYQDYSTQPVVNRDFDLVVDFDQYMAPIRECIHQQSKWLEDVLVFDVYRGEPLPDDKKSISFNMKFRHPERTLDADEINSMMETMLDELNDQFGATIRES